MVCPENISAPCLRIAIVEDDENLLMHFSRVVTAADGMELQASATDLAGGLALLERIDKQADVLLVDIGLPDGSGLSLVDAARQHWPKCEVMVCTSFSDESIVLSAIERGASGYLLKESSPPQIVEAIRSLAQGGSPISPRIARHVLQRLRPAPPANTGAASDAPVLSEREQQVLEALGRGLTYEEIGKQLGISRFTVMTFVRRIYSKLSARSKIEALNAARRHGLVA
jgi:DNA-binding NarL/FixJ family response regulator